MRKFFIVLALALVPALVFAVEFDVNGMLVSKQGYSSASTSSFSLDNFNYGAECRLKIGILRADLAALMTGSTLDSSGFSFVCDGGLCLDILFLRAGIGIGPNIALGSSDNPFIMDGWNAKLSADFILFRDFEFGLVAYNNESGFSDLLVPANLANASNWLYGLTLGFRF